MTSALANRLRVQGWTVVESTLISPGRSIRVLQGVGDRRGTAEIRADLRLFHRRLLRCRTNGLDDAVHVEDLEQLMHVAREVAAVEPGVEVSLVVLAPAPAQRVGRRLEIRRPWTNFPGYFLHRREVEDAYQIARGLPESLTRLGFDIFGLDELVGALRGECSLLGSEIAATIARPLAARSGDTALCVFPSSLAVLPDGSLGVIVPLDTLISWRSTLYEYAEGPNHSQDALSLKAIIDRWTRS